MFFDHPYSIIVFYKSMNVTELASCWKKKKLQQHTKAHLNQCSFISILTLSLRWWNYKTKIRATCSGNAVKTSNHYIQVVSVCAIICCRRLCTCGWFFFTVKTERSFFQVTRNFFFFCSVQFSAKTEYKTNWAGE